MTRLANSDVTDSFAPTSAVTGAMDATSTVAPALVVATLVALTAEPTEPVLAVDVEGVTNVTVVPPAVVTVVAALDAVELAVVEGVDPVATVPAVAPLSLATVDPVDAAAVLLVLLSFVVAPVTVAVVAVVDLLSPVELAPAEVFITAVEPVDVFDESLLVVVAADLVSVVEDVEEASFFPSVVWPLAVSLVVPDVFTSAAGATLITTGVSLACFRFGLQLDAQAQSYQERSQRWPC